jgi:hypothetical protein
VHASATSAAPVEDMLVSGIGHDDLPLDHIDRYFLMRWRRGVGGAVVFSSSGLLEDGWEELPDESITVVDLADMEVSIRELVPGWMNSGRRASRKTPPKKTRRLQTERLPRQSTGD